MGLPWTVQGVVEVHIVNAIGAAATFAVPAAHLGYVVVFLPAVFTGSDPNERSSDPGITKQ